jgi:hypothetical protein
MQFTIPGGTEAVRYLRKIEKFLQNSGNLSTRVRKKIRVENPLLEVEIRMSVAAMHRALMRYCRTVYSCTRPEVVNIWHVFTLCVHCSYTVCTLCTPTAVHHSNHADELRVFLNLLLFSWAERN